MALEMADLKRPSGTRDFLAAELASREAVISAIREVFERYGYEALATPAFERLDVLTGKYGEEGDQLIFPIQRRGERGTKGEADLALRYDLTVPLARVIAEHSGKIVLPYKRYQIAPVWRAERPGKGRLREFFQCDIDVVGSASLLADAEVVLAVWEAVSAAGVSGATVQLNSRKVLYGLLEALRVPEHLQRAVLISLDKLEKIGPHAVCRELEGRGVAAPAVASLEDFITSDDSKERLFEFASTSALGQAGTDDVRRLAEHVRSIGSQVDVGLAPLLARGLDYYTGCIFEVVVPGYSGSIAGGGRYDSLIGTLTGRDLPASGGSLGLERIIDITRDQNSVQFTGPDALVTVWNNETEDAALAAAQDLRRSGVSTSLYLGSGRLEKQLGYASRMGCKVCVILGPSEVAGGQATVRDMRSGRQTSVSLGSLGKAVSLMVNGEASDGVRPSPDTQKSA